MNQIVTNNIIESELSIKIKKNLNDLIQHKFNGDKNILYKDISEFIIHLINLEHSKNKNGILSFTKTISENIIFIYDSYISEFEYCQKCKVLPRNLIYSNCNNFKCCEKIEEDVCICYKNSTFEYCTKCFCEYFEQEIYNSIFDAIKFTLEQSIEIESIKSLQNLVRCNVVCKKCVKYISPFNWKCVLINIEKNKTNNDSILEIMKESINNQRELNEIFKKTFKQNSKLLKRKYCDKNDFSIKIDKENEKELNKFIERLILENESNIPYIHLADINGVEPIDPKTQKGSNRKCYFCNQKNRGHYLKTCKLKTLFIKKYGVDELLLEAVCTYENKKPSYNEPQDYRRIYEMKNEFLLNYWNQKTDAINVIKQKVENFIKQNNINSSDSKSSSSSPSSSPLIENNDISGFLSNDIIDNLLFNK